MPVPLQDPNDDFCAAALRHYDDMVALAEVDRYDGAVNHAGFVQECALKTRLVGQLTIATLKGRDFGHDLRALSGPELCLLAALGLPTGSELAAALKPNRVIDHKHPDRRYWPDHWTSDDVEGVLQDAAVLLRELIIRPTLDTGGSLP